MKRNRFTAALLCLVLLCAVLLGGCKEEAPAVTTQAPTATEQAEEGGQRLRITGTRNADSGKEEYCVSETDRSVTVYFYDDPAITLNGQPVPLQEAVEQGRVTPEEIASWARLDAVDGYCKVNAASELGITTFVYIYVNQFTVVSAYDVLETPSGKQHLIEEVKIYAPNTSVGSISGFYDENMERLDKEDWGVTLTIEDATPNGFTLVCVQSGGGHQVGVLTARVTSLTTENDFVDRIDMEAWTQFCENAMIVHEGTTTRYTVDWTAACGQLPSGNYWAEVYVFDDYNEEEIHPLIVKHEKAQKSLLEFSIP